MEKQIGKHSSNDNVNTFLLGYAKTPLTKPVSKQIPVGTSLADAIKQIEFTHYDRVVVMVNDKIYDKKDHWYCPKSTDIVTATMVPNDPVTIGAVTISWWAIAGIAAASIVAGFIGYYLFKPDQPKTSDTNRLPAIQGFRNQSRKYEPVRAVLGKRQVAPDYAALPYTYRVGNNEWYRVLFNVGFGPLKLENFRVGETLLENFEHRIAWLDHYEKLDTNTADFNAMRSLWPNDTVEIGPNITLNGPSSNIQFSNGITPYVNATAPDTDKISIEFLGSRGLRNPNAKNNNGVIGIEHSYVNPENGHLIKVVKVQRTVSLNQRFNPVVYGLYRVGSSYRVTYSRGENNDGRSTRIVPNRLIRRSWTFPNNAIVKLENTESGEMAHVDMEVLDGQSRTTEEVIDNSVTTVTTQWSRNSSLAAYGRRSRSNAQYRGDVVYTPIGGTVSGLETETRKVYPRETPNDASWVSDIVVSKFRSIRNQTDDQFRSVLGYDEAPLYIDGVARRVYRPVTIALEIKATDQLSGMLDNFTVEATSCVPEDWEADWRVWYEHSLKPTQNPADAYRWMLQGPMQKAPIANRRLDLDSLEEWRDYCDLPAPTNYYSGSQWRISYDLMQESTLLAELKKIAYTGRAEPSTDIGSGLFGVVVNERQTTPVQLFTPKNTWDFSASRQYPEQTDGIRFEFDNEDKQYQQDEEYFRDPRITEVMRNGKWIGTTIEGIPNAKMATRVARFDFYEQNLNREVYKLKCDAEGLVCRRGSLVRIQNDILDVGLGSGRVMEIGDGFVRIDETIELNQDSIGETFGLQPRYRTGKVPEITIAGEYDGDGVFLVDNDDITSLNEGDFLIYGELGSETIDAIVKEIEYGENNEASITMTNYDQTLFDIDEDLTANPLPEFISQLNDRVELIPPTAPVLTSIDDQAGIDIAKQQIYLSIEQESQLNDSVQSYTFQQRSISLVEEDGITPIEQEEIDEELDAETDIDSDWEFAGALTGSETLYTFQGIERGTGYRFRARARGDGDLFSAWSTPVNVLVPLSLPPNNVDTSTITFEDTVRGMILRWNRVIDPDLADYEIRTNTNVGEQEGLVGSTVGLNFNVGYEDQETTYYIYARTIFNIYSLEGAQVVVPSFYVPTTPIERSQADGRDGTRIRWQPIGDSDFFKGEYVSQYEVRTNTNVGEDDGFVMTTPTASANIGYVDGNNLITYYVYAISVGGFYSPVPLEDTPVNPDAPEDFTPDRLNATPIDSNVILDWLKPEGITYPVDFYEVRQLKVGRVEFEDLGTFSATYASILERTGGTYQFEVRTVDLGNNRSNWVGVDARVFDPTDFVLFSNLSADFSDAELVGAALGTHDGQPVVYAPLQYNLLSGNKTFQDAIDETDSLGDPTPIFFDDETIFFDDETIFFQGAGSTVQDKIDFVGPYLPQLTFNSGDGDSTYAQIFDIFEGQEEEGLFIANTSIAVDFDITQMSPSEDFRTRIFIAWSLDGDTWEEDEGDNVFIEDQFRYVRVTIWFIAEDDGSGLPFVRLNNVNLTADVKQVTDQGEADVEGKFLEDGVTENPNFPTEVEFRKLVDSDGNLVNYFVDILAVNGTLEMIDPDVDEDAISIYTQFEYREDPNDPTSPVVRDRFKVFAKDTVTGEFVPARISWIARGIANVAD